MSILHFSRICKIKIKKLAPEMEKENERKTERECERKREIEKKSIANLSFDSLILNVIVAS